MKRLRRYAKTAVFWFSYALTFPLILLTRVDDQLGGSSFFFSCATLLALFPGKVGSTLRLSYYTGTLKSVDQNVLIGFGTFFSKREVMLEPHVCVGAYCIIGNSHIGRRTEIASRVSILSGRHQHDFSDGRRGPRPAAFSNVRIGEHTWIGEGSIVMADVGDRCIIGAGSVVAKPIPSDCVAVGNPARIIRVPNDAE